MLPYPRTAATPGHRRQLPLGVVVHCKGNACCVYVLPAALFLSSLQLCLCSPHVSVTSNRGDTFQKIQPLLPLTLEVPRESSIYGGPRPCSSSFPRAPVLSTGTWMVDIEDHRRRPLSPAATASPSIGCFPLQQQLLLASSGHRE